MTSVDLAAAFAGAAGNSSVRQEASRGGELGVEPALGFDQLLSERTVGPDLAGQDSRSHGRRGLPASADVRGMLERLARRWAVEVVPPQSIAASLDAGVTPLGPGEDALPIRHDDLGARDEQPPVPALHPAVPIAPTDRQIVPPPADGVLVPPPADRQLVPPPADRQLVPPSIDEPETGPGASLLGGPRPLDAVAPDPHDPVADIRSMREALSRLRRESERLGDGAPTTEKVAVPPQAEEAVTTSSTGRVHQPSHGSPEEKELSVRPLPRFVVRAAPALEHTPPVEKAAPSRPLTGSAGQDGEWLRHARQLLYAAIDAQAPSHRAVRPAEGAVPRQSETDAAAHAGQPPRDDRAPLAASALERPSSLETVVSLTVGAGEGDARLAAVERRIARRYVPPSSKARGVMVEAVRSAAQAVAAQLSALGPGAAADAAVPIRAGEARRPFSVSAPAPSADVLLQPPARPQVSSPTEGLTRGETLAPEVQLQLSSQIVQAIRLQWGSDGGDVHLRLQPQYLGELTISLKVDHGAVTAHLEASTPEVRWWIESNDGLLRHSLAAHDLRLDRLVVTEQERSASTPDSDARQDTEHRPPPRRRQASDPDADTTFEIVV